MWREEGKREEGNGWGERRRGKGGEGRVEEGRRGLGGEEREGEGEEGRNNLIVIFFPIS